MIKLFRRSLILLIPILLMAGVSVYASGTLDAELIIYRASDTNKYIVDWTSATTDLPVTGDKLTIKLGSTTLTTVELNSAIVAAKKCETAPIDSLVGVNNRVIDLIFTSSTGAEKKVSINHYDPPSLTKLSVSKDGTNIKVSNIPTGLSSINLSAAVYVGGTLGTFSAEEIKTTGGASSITFPVSDVTNLADVFEDGGKLRITADIDRTSNSNNAKTYPNDYKVIRDFIISPSNMTSGNVVVQNNYGKDGVIYITNEEALEVGSVVKLYIKKTADGEWQSFGTASGYTVKTAKTITITSLDFTGVSSLGITLTPYNGVETAMCTPSIESLKPSILLKYAIAPSTTPTPAEGDYTNQFVPKEARRVEVQNKLSSARIVIPKNLMYNKNKTDPPSSTVDTPTNFSDYAYYRDGAIITVYDKPQTDTTRKVLNTTTYKKDSDTLISFTRKVIPLDGAKVYVTIREPKIAPPSGTTLTQGNAQTYASTAESEEWEVEFSKLTQPGALGANSVLFYRDQFTVLVYDVESGDTVRVYTQVPDFDDATGKYKTTPKPILTAKVKSPKKVKDQPDPEPYKMLAFYNTKLYTLTAPEAGTTPNPIYVTYQKQDEMESKAATINKSDF